MYNVFVNYHRDNGIHETFGNSLVNVLRQAKCTCWTKEYSLLPGQNDSIEHKNAIRNADYVLNIEKYNIQGEYTKWFNYAIEHDEENPKNHIFIIPIIITVETERVYKLESQLCDLKPLKMMYNNKDQILNGLMELFEIMSLRPPKDYAYGNEEFVKQLAIEFK